MRDFEYESPGTVAEAVGLLWKHRGIARSMAGGTDLIDQVRTGLLAPDLLVDLKKIRELHVLELSSAGLRVGAAVPCSTIYADCQIECAYAALTDSCRLIGGIQIQNRATVGGNLCNASPAADSVPSLIALGAMCVVAGPEGTREIPAQDFCTGPRRNALQAGEMLVELRFPRCPPHRGSHYRRFTPRNEMDIAVVGAGASVVLDEHGEHFVSARIGLGAVAPTPIFAEEASDLLAGQLVGDAAISQASEAARAAARPIDDMRGTREFRLQLVQVLADRALRTAVARARETRP